MTDNPQSRSGAGRFLPRIGSPAYHLLLAGVAIFILGPLGGVTASVAGMCGMAVLIDRMQLSFPSGGIVCSGPSFSVVAKMSFSEPSLVGSALRARRIAGDRKPYPPGICF